jgi:hypothetical protein
MAFAYTKTGIDSEGNKKVSRGLFTNTSSGTGGDIYTGLQKVEQFRINPSGTAHAAVPYHTETLPCSDPVTIVTSDQAAGGWEAVGF